MQHRRDHAQDLSLGVPDEVKDEAKTNIGVIPSFPAENQQD